MKVRVIAATDWLPELDTHLPGEVTRGEDPADVLVVPMDAAAHVLEAFDDEIPVPVVWVVPKDARRMELERLSRAAVLSRFVFEPTAAAASAAIEELIARLAAQRKSGPGADTTAPDPSEAPGTAPAEGPGTASPDAPAAARARESMEELWKRFRVTMLDRLAVLEAVGAEVLEGDVDPDRLADAHRAAHKLHGSLGTFGLGYGSKLAAELESLVEDAPEDGELSSGDRYRFSELVVGLRHEIEMGRPTDPGTRRRRGGATSPESAGLLLVVDPDPRRREKLTAAGTAHGWRPHGVATPSEGLDALDEAGRPALAVVDPTAGDPESLERLLEELVAGSDPVPVVFQGSTRSLEERLRGVTMGARVFVDADASPDAIMGRAESLMEEDNAGGGRVLVVDDDPSVLGVLSFILRGAGYSARTLSSPLGFWRKLEAVEPDLLVLDVEMPDVGGRELCRAIRGDARWSDLPILVLTERTGTREVMAAFEAGADDIVLKPVAGPELLARIESRLVRRGRGQGPDGGEEDSGEAAEGQGSGDPEPGEAPDRDAATIVIVEDDEALGTLVCRTLDDRGYHTRWIKDGAEAAELLTGDSPAVRAAVVILDVGLPGMDGLSLLRRLARDGVTRRTRVLMLTARSAESEVVKALELGAFDHVPKPFSVSELIHRVRRALGHRDAS